MSLVMRPVDPDPTSAPIPFVGLDRLHARLAGELRAAFDRVLAGGGFVLGEEVTAFEEEFAASCGTAHCAGVASGTSAIHLALAAAGIGPGDEVVVPAHTFIATALGVVHAGATPVLCDVDDATGLIDPDAAAAAVTPRTAAIIGVHLYGLPCDMTALRALAGRDGLFLLEDAAQAHGARDRGRRAGALGDAAAFSFYPSKNLGALGDGGAVTTADAALDEAVRRLRNLGQPRKGVHERIGVNSRLDGIQAALLRVKLPHLDAANAARRRHAARYRQALPAELRPAAGRDGAEGVHHLFAVRTRLRDDAAAALGRAGIGVGIHYHPAVHEHVAFAGALGATGAFPRAEAWAREELSLPMFAELTGEEIDRVVDMCRRWAAGTEEGQG